MSALGPAGLFTGVAIALLLGDLLLLRRRAERLSFAEAMARTAFFVACACAIALVLGFAPPDTLASLGLRPETISRGTGGQEFIQAYLVELTLSVDNVLVIALIFGHFGLSPLAQHRVLFWGVISAFVMRGALILVGAAALTRFEWMTYVFGVILLWSAVKLLRSPTVTYDPNEGRIVAWATRLFDIPSEEKSDRLFVRRKGRWALSALVLPLLAIEGTDLVFAFDSIPAVLAVTNDPTIEVVSWSPEERKKFTTIAQNEWKNWAGRSPMAQKSFDAVTKYYAHGGARVAMRPRESATAPDRSGRFRGSAAPSESSL